MNIRCPHCQTVFRVNPDRIPPAGVRARCARCGDSFTVTPPKPATTLGGAPAAQPQPAAPAAPPPASFGAPRPAPPPPPPPAYAAPPPAYNAPARPSAPPFARPATPPAEEASRPAAAPAATATRSPFGQRDPNARAERIARALVSDIVAYHPERRDASLEAGTLRTEFREEIMKSWEEYVAQVGQPLAKSTPYFREALNAILAKGQKLF
jgi:predicted Zn finger-like uncharacterized protein